MRSVKVLVLLTLLAAVPILAAEPTRSAARPMATMHITLDSVSWEGATGLGELELAVAAPDGAVVRRQFAAGEAPSLDLFDERGERLADGVYTYELRTARELRPGHSLLLHGSIVVRDASFVDPAAGRPDGPVAKRPDRGGGLRSVTEAIVDTSGACFGSTCVAGDEGSPLRLKDYDVRIYFDDTPDVWSPSRDWGIEVNDGLVGDQERFSILDYGDPGSTPFTIRGGAPSHSLYVNSSGNIGLGTSTPGAKLHLYGTATSDVVASAGPDPTNGPAFNLGYGGNTFGRGAGFLHARPDASATAPNPSLRFLTANVERMIITNTGNVGIGTTAPGAALDVRVSASSAATARLYNASATGYPGIEYADENSAITLFFGLDNASNTTRFNSINNHPIVILTNSTERARVTSAGDVGIGTSSPSSKLHVNGGDIRVSGGSFIDDNVTLLAPDYVFEPDYELMPLDELAAFVRAERHLPNVPKAAEIKASGLNLSQFQMRLLEKIEELTLYTLAQEERLATQQATIAELAAKVEKLEVK